MRISEVDPSHERNSRTDDLLGQFKILAGRTDGDEMVDHAWKAFEEAVKGNRGIEEKRTDADEDVDHAWKPFEEAAKSKRGINGKRTDGAEAVHRA